MCKFDFISEQIDQFCRADGTLVSIPVKLNKKIAVLRHIAAELSPDTAVLRRHMIEYGILERNGASVYWVSVNS